MSEQEMVTGTIKLIAKKDDVERISKAILKQKGLQPNNGERYVITLTEEYYDDYVVIENDLYEVKSESLDWDELFEINKVKDGEYRFVTSFYNGGTYLSEVLQRAKLEEAE